MTIFIFSFLSFTYIRYTESCFVSLNDNDEWYQFNDSNIYYIDHPFDNVPSNNIIFIGLHK